MQRVEGKDNGIYNDECISKRVGLEATLQLGRSMTYMRFYLC